MRRSKQFHARLDDDLLEDLNSTEILNHFEVENVSQLARKVLRKAVDEAREGKGKLEKKVEFRV